MPRLRQRLHIPVVAGGLAAAIGFGVFLSPPVSVNAFGTLGRAEAAAPDPALAAAPDELSFPGVQGVDLVALGYRGVDLDAVTVRDLDGALPELPMERATQLRSRIVVATAHVEGLRGAEYVLYETARSMKRDVRKAATAVQAAADLQAKKEGRLARLRKAIADQQALQVAQPALDVQGGVTQSMIDVADAELFDAAAARAAAEERVVEVEARRQAHRAALDLTHRAANRMDDHIEYLDAELRQARAGMLAAGRWLADVERGRRDLPIVRVGNFRVHASIAEPLREMLAAARADGIDLRGDGYRSTKRQIELRRQNCGPSQYQIFEAPSSSCSPPTAKPYRSLHESGLALDFRNGTEGISSRRDSAYRWLAANAAAYGFFNLSSEPWHWSVSAR